jgi:hypothetical protein
MFGYLGPSEVIFRGGRLHDFQNFVKCFSLYLSRPTNVTKHDSSSSEVIFHGRRPDMQKRARSQDFSGKVLIK